MLRSLLTGVFLLTFCLLTITNAEAQVPILPTRYADTTHPVSVDPELLALQMPKTPKEYIIAGIKNYRHQIS